MQAIVLGLIQGITEFAPISSSGHLILVPWLFDWEILADPELNKTFDVALHLGTLAGGLAYFRADILRYLRALAASIRERSISTSDERLAWGLVVGTIPGAVVGAAFARVIENDLGRPLLIAVMLAVFGVLLWVVDRRARTTRSMEKLGIRGALFLGVAQAVSLQPGVSRSGITISAGRSIGLDRRSAARFSFLLSLPIIAGAGTFKAFHVLGGGIPAGMAWPFAAGVVSSAVSGYLVIWGLLAYLRTKGFGVFVIYRLAVAAAILGIIAAGLRPASAL